MAVCCSGSSLTSVIALWGLSALGVGGYTYFSGECGSCTGAPEAALVTQEASAPCCAAADTTTVAQEESCCGAEAAAVINAANTTESEAGSCEQSTAAPENCGGCCEGERKAQTSEQIAQKPAGR